MLFLLSLRLMSPYCFEITSTHAFIQGLMMKSVHFLGVLYVAVIENDKHWQTQHHRIKDYVNEQF